MLGSDDDAVAPRGRGPRAPNRQSLADAERDEAERRAELEAPAKAQKARTIVEAEAAAQSVRIAAEADAAAIYMKLEAEARGQYEILAKKADALREVVQACGGAKEAFQLMMIEHLDTLAETSAKAISNIKFDKVVVWDGGGNGGATSGFLQNMANTLPHRARSARARKHGARWRLHLALARTLTPWHRPSG